MKENMWKFSSYLFLEIKKWNFKRVSLREDFLDPGSLPSLQIFYITSIFVTYFKINNIYL